MQDLEPLYDTTERLAREIARHNRPHTLLDPGKGVVLDALVGELCKVVGASPECKYAIKRLLAAMREQARSDDDLPQPPSDDSTLLRELRSGNKRARVEVREKNDGDSCSEDL